MSEHTAENHHLSAVIGSKHTQVAAVFNSEQELQESVEAITRENTVEKRQIAIIDPMDSSLSEKLEGASTSIGQIMWRSHLFLGAAGLLIGLAVAFLLVAFGPALTQNNPLFTYIALISPGIFIGVFIAGLISLRPDRDEIITTIRHAIRRKKYALVVNLKKNQSATQICRLLSQRSDKVVEAIQP